MQGFILVIQFLMLLFCQETPSAASVRIRPLDESGRLLQLSRAEVYLDVWGHGHLVERRQDARGVHLPLDASILCDLQPGTCRREDLWGARVILQAEGCPVVTSGIFAPLGMEMQGARLTSPDDIVVMGFDRIPQVRIGKGETAEIEVVFRPRTAKVLKVENEKGEGIPGIRVTDRLLFASSNHCGAMEGEILLQGETDTFSEIEIPDADAECAFEFTDLRHYALLGAEISALPISAVRLPDDPVTTIVLRALDKSDLRLEFTDHGVPVAGLQLVSCLAHCRCGACCGMHEGETDEDGRVLLQDFYPEEMELLLMDDSEKVWWKGSPSPSAVDSTGWIRIEIGTARL